MNITDIAKLAGVSPSTVSKVINGKDESISVSTRQKVLDIVKENNYSPYSAVISSGKKHFNLSVILGEGHENLLVLDGITGCANKRGYTVTVTKIPADTYPLVNFSNISSGTDGIIFESPLLQQNIFSSGKGKLNMATMPFSLGMPDVEANIDYIGLDKAAYFIMSRLCTMGHTEIACLTPSSPDNASPFSQGYFKYIFDNFKGNNGICSDSLSPDLLKKIAERKLSAIVCSDYKTAFEAYLKLSSMNYSIPREISLICTCKSNELPLVHPAISAVLIPYEDFGAYLCNKTIDIIEKNSFTQGFKFDTPKLVNPESIAPPLSGNSKKILVIGSINIDHYLNLPQLPSTGTTVSTDTSSAYPGGKGTNCAVGSARLGHSTELLGAVGGDVDSSVIFQVLSDNGVIYKNVKKFDDSQTGKAYIFVDRKGESIISLLSGANKKFDAECIKDSENSFKNAAFCLLSTEIPLPVIPESCKLAHKYGAQTILKPSLSFSFDEALLSQIDIFVPNLSELNKICPGEDSVEDKLERLTNAGVKTIILTLGAEGCILKTNSLYKKFDAANFKAVDNTGACDAFISALASYLLYGYDIESAVKIATYAAGFSVTREGVIPALVDKNTLENYIRTKCSGLILG